MLPEQYDQFYVEPFAGMAAVLLARPRVRMELINDLNGRVVNWWRMVRDQPEELGRLIDYTPHSRAEYDWALANMDNPNIPAVRRALAFTIAVHQSMMHADAPNYWFRHMSLSVGSFRLPRSEDIDMLAQRLRSVQLDTQDAVQIIRAAAPFPESVIYCDPPYPTADVTPYGVSEVNQDEIAAALLEVRGAAAISGYGEEWDRLGWRKECRPALRHNRTGGDPRVEVLWLNERAGAAKPRLL